MHYCEACRTSRDWPATTQDIATCDLCHNLTICNHAPKAETMPRPHQHRNLQVASGQPPLDHLHETPVRPQRVRPLYNARDAERMRFWWSARLAGASRSGADKLLDEFDKRFPAKGGEQ